MTDNKYDVPDYDYNIDEEEENKNEAVTNNK
jgi:hypothetical protein